MSFDWSNVVYDEDIDVVEEFEDDCLFLKCMIGNYDICPPKYFYGDKKSTYLVEDFIQAWNDYLVAAVGSMVRARSIWRDCDLINIFSLLLRGKAKIFLDSYTDKHDEASYDKFIQDFISRFHIKPVEPVPVVFVIPHDVSIVKPKNIINVVPNVKCGYKNGRNSAPRGKWVPKKPVVLASVDVVKKDVVDVHVGVVVEEHVVEGGDGKSDGNDGSACINQPANEVAQIDETPMVVPSVDVEVCDVLVPEVVTADVEEPVLVPAELVIESSKTVFPEVVSCDADIMVSSEDAISTGDSNDIVVTSSFTSTPSVVASPILPHASPVSFDVGSTMIDGLSLPCPVVNMPDDYFPFDRGRKIVIGQSYDLFGLENGELYSSICTKMVEYIVVGYMCMIGCLYMATAHMYADTLICVPFDRGRT